MLSLILFLFLSSENHRESKSFEISEATFSTFCSKSTLRLVAWMRTTKEMSEIYSVIPHAN